MNCAESAIKPQPMKLLFNASSFQSNSRQCWVF